MVLFHMSMAFAQALTFTLQGYIPDENMMFRKEAIIFHEKPPAATILGNEVLLKWGKIEKTFKGFKLTAAAWRNPKRRNHRHPWTKRHWQNHICQNPCWS